MSIARAVWRSRAGRWVLGALTVSTLTVIAMNALVCARGEPICEVDAAPGAPVAIVFGAGLNRDGSPELVLADRLAVAVELYRAGKVGKLLVSGDHGRAGYDETLAMSTYLESRGVAAADIFLDHAGFDTYSTLYRARDVFGVRSALLVSQSFHLPRALYIARDLGLSATGVRADRHRYAARWSMRAREVGARVKAVVWCEALRPRPRFLGPEIPIAGDGRVTRDRATSAR